MPAFACTFTPLAGGRYRWNQGPRQKPVILTKGRLDGFRRIKFNEALAPAPAQPVVRVETLRLRDGWAYCVCGVPHTMRWNESQRRLKCTCGRELLIKRSL